MSTKIYEAYRIDIERLDEVLDFVRDKVYELAIDCIKTTFVDNKAFDFNTRNLIKVIIEISNEVSFLDYGLNVWIKDDYCYIIPVTSSNIYENIFPEFAEDFSYWDGADKPDDVSGTEWDTRAITWKSINCGIGRASHNARRLYYSVIDMAFGRDLQFESEIRNHFSHGVYER